MSIAPYLKEIGRGHAGARALDVAQSTDLMRQVLDGTATDLEVGGFALAMRIKGETCDELVGFSRALEPHLACVPSDKPVLVIPSYNGARRLPNLTPLLAMAMARRGARVLVHGPRRDPTRVTSAEVFAALGLPACDGAAAVHAAWRRGEPAHVPTDVLSPALQHLLDVRWVVGLRNSGHTMAKLIAPVAGAPVLRLASHTHPEFGRLMGEFAQATGASMMLLRGTEGEPVADPRRCPRMDLWLNGRLDDAMGCPPQDGPLVELPALPREITAASTAAYTQAVIAGTQSLPAPIERQAGLLAQALAQLQSAHAG
ncbi:DNA-binding protein YbiB [Ideonella sp. A 288]|uniref:DNA-binding protein YbiB n=1 Tax=Ideonella sp. A 288 TaxID=1962181 RepID=UPI000B4B66AB|nr:DNA-binding protein YbiB [Ideonella sp. A 288]